MMTHRAEDAGQILAVVPACAQCPTTVPLKYMDNTIHKHIKGRNQLLDNLDWIGVLTSRSIFEQVFSFFFTLLSGLSLSGLHLSLLLSAWQKNILIISNELKNICQLVLPCSKPIKHPPCLLFLTLYTNLTTL